MYFVVKIDHINFLCKKTTLKSIKSFKILTSVGFIAYRSHCSRKRQYQSVTQVVIIYHHCSRWLSTCGYYMYFTSPQLLSRMVFFYKHIPTNQSFLSTFSNHVNCHAKWKVLILLYETELHVNTTCQFYPIFYKAI